MKTFKQLVDESLKHINELLPWDLVERLKNENFLIVDIREPYEYKEMHIQNSLNVPRGILETACEYDYEETIPELVTARQKNIVVVCRSGNRSIFVADVMQQLGYEHVWSLKTGLRGWNDYEQPLVDQDDKPVDIEAAEEYFLPKVRPEQRKPK